MAIEGVSDTMLAAQVVEVLVSCSRVFSKAESNRSTTTPTESTNIPTPTRLSPHDLLLKVEVASLCHTDGMVSSGVFSSKLLCTASHEGCGEVVALGFRHIFQTRRSGYGSIATA